MSTGIWYKDVLAGLGVPDTTANENALIWWSDSEGVAPQNYNWLATTGTYGQPTKGVVAPNGGNPVMAFANYDAGVAATVATIKGYPSIVQAFTQNSQTAIFLAINKSGWCKGCQGGNYPNVLAQHTGVVTTPGSPAAAAQQAATNAETEGPRWLGLLTPGRCVFGNFSFLGANACIIDAGQARKIKGYTVMAIGGVGVVLGIALVAAVGLKSPTGRSVSRTIGGALPGPVGSASRSSGTVRREPAGYQAGNRSNPQTFGSRPSVSAADRRELEQRRAEDAAARDRQRSDQQEREEGFAATRRRERAERRTAA